MAKIDEFYHAIGRFVITWAELERYLDVLLLVIFRRLNPHERNATLPHQLSAKIRYIRRALRADVIAPERRDAIFKLLNEIEALADTRHDFVHGAPTHRLLKRGSRTLTFARFLQPSGRPRRSAVKVTAAQINDVSDRLWDLSDDLLSAAEGILGTTRSPKVH